MPSRVVAAVCLLLLLTACSSVAPPAGGGEAPTRFTGFCRSAEAADLLSYYSRLRAMSADELAAEYAAAQQAHAKQKTDSSRLRLAMLLSMPAAGFRDDARAAALAEEVANRKNGEGSTLRPLALLLAGVANEQRRQEERNQKLAQKLQDEEKRGDALQQKLDGLKAIEKNILNREPTKPVNVK